MMDNRQFNVNGEGKAMLLRALELACIQEGHEDRPARIRSWRITANEGMVLSWTEDHGNALPGDGASAEEFLPILWAWLENPKERDKINLEGWDRDADHDGSNGRGWRVYCGDWGYVGGNHYAICAVKPVFLWFGK